MTLEQKITTAALDAIKAESGQDVPETSVVLQKTRKDFDGDLTIVVFPFLKMLRRSPEQCAELLGRHIADRVEDVSGYNVIKGFLNLSLTKSFWLDFLKSSGENPGFGLQATSNTDQRPVVVEFSSPNTNKPLHLGHIRNNLLGCAVANIIEAVGNKVVRVNLVNDRGIHICKSMLAWMRYGQGVTPESSGKKGDKLVGDFYVKFETELRREVKYLKKALDISEEEARRTAPLMLEAQELLRKWEERDPETVEVWKMMNGWVYAGFDQTYERMGIAFDKVYYESETYLFGKELVLEGLKKNKLYRKEDGSVWAGLSSEKLDDKLLLRADGTSVYMTQDIGTARLRYDDFKAKKMIYVVGNEQNHHFNVLKKVLKKLDQPYADAIQHLSYGMVELPDGRMKSREGTVVDADDLVDEMFATAQRITEELGKTQAFSEEEKDRLYHTIAMGALKYFILKVDPKKNMLFNPEESIDFNGNTGPFIQYTYARISSILRMSAAQSFDAKAIRMDAEKINKEELVLLKTLHDFPALVMEAAKEQSPALIANFAYELCKEYNRFYHEHSVLKEPDEQVSAFRLHLSHFVSQCIHQAMRLLGIDVPEKM